MKKLQKLKEKEDGFQKSLVAMNKQIHKRRKELLALEEISWDLQDKLNKLQREIIFQFKGLSKDEVLAIRSGLSIEEIRKAQALLTKAESPMLTGVAGKEFVILLEAEAQRDGKKD